MKVKPIYHNDFINFLYTPENEEERTALLDIALQAAQNKRIKEGESMEEVIEEIERNQITNDALIALKAMCEHCEKLMMEIPSKGDLPHRECPFRHISNDYCDEYETIKKALEAKE